MSADPPAEDTGCLTRLVGGGTIGLSLSGSLAGSFQEIEHEGQINCVFKLDERTLASIHPIYKQRCEIDGLDYRLHLLVT